MEAQKDRNITANSLWSFVKFNERKLHNGAFQGNLIKTYSPKANSVQRRPIIHSRPIVLERNMFIYETQ